MGEAAGPRSLGSHPGKTVFTGSGHTPVLAAMQHFRYLGGTSGVGHGGGGQAPREGPARMTMSPRDYVLISPCRNEAAYMRRTLDSV
ncbi:MAG: hypothetical protein AAF844_17550, partial [Pseudomonadota bacterium]